MGESGAGRAGLTTAGWSRLHHGIDPDRVPLLRAWLSVVRALARPVRRVHPLVFTALGVALAVVAIFVTPWLAVVLVLASVLCDALDGAVALASGRASRLGALADRIADRIADCAFALVIWRCGAPLWLALVAAALSLAHEAIRVARGGTALAYITVAERPSRAICTMLAGATAAVGSWAPTVCAGVWAALAVIGLVQVARA